MLSSASPGVAALGWVPVRSKNPSQNCWLRLLALLRTEPKQEDTKDAKGRYCDNNSCKDCSFYIFIDIPCFALLCWGGFLLRQGWRSYASLAKQHPWLCVAMQQSKESIYIDNDMKIEDMLRIFARRSPDTMQR